MAWDAAVLQCVMGILVGIPSLLCGLVIAILSCAFFPCVALWKLKRKHVFLLTVNLFCLVISSFCFDHSFSHWLCSCFLCTRSCGSIAAILQAMSFPQRLVVLTRVKE
jgi:hypothetical protein